MDHNEFMKLLALINHLAYNGRILPTEYMTDEEIKAFEEARYDMASKYNVKDLQQILINLTRQGVNEFVNNGMKLSTNLIDGYGFMNKDAIRFVD